MSLVKENINVALRSIRAQKLRTILTATIIAIGIMALVGILTSIDAVENKLLADFSRLGANTFSIMKKNSRGNRQGKTSKTYTKIEYQEVNAFKDSYHFPALVSLSTRVSFVSTVKRKNEKTDPNVSIIAGDENYLVATGYELESGRNFSAADIVQGINAAIIGKNIVDKVFTSGENPLGQSIFIGGAKFRVIGILESKGNSIGFSGDNQVIIPLGYAHLNSETDRTTYSINIQAKDPNQIDNAIGEATGLMRKIRKDPLGKEDSFRITRSESLANELLENLSATTLAASVIGAITLIGAAIGLMNIMLVSVTERTKEIGLRKSLGASSRTILGQFLIEAIVIGQLGGYLGIILGIVIGNVTASIVGTSFIIPWDWMIIGALLCLVIGVISGIYPARKAARLDPIDALRYE
jgi:putative ABC transport system permease protein